MDHADTSGDGFLLLDREPEPPGGAALPGAEPEGFLPPFGVCWYAEGDRCCRCCQVRPAMSVTGEAWGVGVDAAVYMGPGL